MPVTVLEANDAALGQAMATSLDSFSSAATHVSDSTGLSRSNLHVVFTVAPVDPTHLLEGGASYSLDGGVTWASQGSTTYYEQHIDLSAGRWYQAWQFDYDMVSAKAKVGQEVCYKVWLTDTTTMETVWLNAR